MPVSKYLRWVYGLAAAAYGLIVSAVGIHGLWMWPTEHWLGFGFLSLLGAVALIASPWIESVMYWLYRKLIAEPVARITEEWIREFMAMREGSPDRGDSKKDTDPQLH